MDNKEKQARFVYEALMIMGVLALLCFICRLWPVLLLVILGVLIVAVRMVFLTAKKVETVEPMPVPQFQQVPVPTETDVKALAYSVVLRRVTELIAADYPEARWVWEVPNAKTLFDTGADLFVLLNRAGGYRRAKVNIQNLLVVGIVYEKSTEQDNPGAAPEESELHEENEKESFQLIAFEWAEAHIFELNTRCNEAIGQNLSELLVYADELPAKESWEDICGELCRAGLEDVCCVPEGIKINLTQ
ncbi:hypothetical protein D3Z47_02130 [Lachnospiraceae bacterium]|nr:hypothetical protein [Lachnospiraceae bacterium]